MQVVDGKLYPPMAAKVKRADGKYHWGNPSTIGVWQQATEDPANIKKIKKTCKDPFLTGFKYILVS